jgi:hypothetical protein
MVLGMNFDDLYEAFKDVEEVKSINLQNMYNEFNKRLFNNKLPKVPLKWTTSKKYGGLVKFNEYKPKYKWQRDGWRIDRDTVQMQMSKAFKRHIDEFKGVFIHEMIHVWHVFLSGKSDYEIIQEDDHGLTFETKRLELERKSGIHIPKSELLEDNILSDDFKKKVYGAVIMRYATGEDGIIVFQDKVLKDNMIKIRAILITQKWYKKEVTDLYFITSDNLILQKYPIKRSPKLNTVSVIKGKDVEAILKDGSTVVIDHKVNTIKN